jgi:hypothetical protein
VSTGNGGKEMAQMFRDIARFITAVAAMLAIISCAEQDVLSPPSSEGKPMTYAVQKASRATSAVSKK